MQASSYALLNTPDGRDAISLESSPTLSLPIHTDIKSMIYNAHIETVNNGVIAAPNGLIF